MKLCTTRRFLKIITIPLIGVCLLYELVAVPWQHQWNPKYFTRYKPFRNFVHKYPEKKQPSNKTAQILLWNTWFGSSYWNLDFENMFKKCEVTACKLTAYKSLLNESDALLFHVGDLPKIYNPKFMPNTHVPSQVWILHNVEPTTNIQVDLSHYKDTFNWTATYRTDSDIFMPYFKVVKRKKPLQRAVNVTEKTKGVAWVASNCRDSVRRQVLVKQLRRYVDVDTFGECGENELRRGPTTTRILSQYKFYLAFESSYCVDYVTEKFGAALERHQIPIVSGAVDYASVAPPKSYINVLDFDSVQQLAEHIKYLDQNDTAYESYLQWTKDYELDKRSYMERGVCEICKRLHDVNVTSQVYPDVSQYFSDDICPIYTFLQAKYRSIQGWLIHFGYV